MFVAKHVRDQERHSRWARTHRSLHVRLSSGVRHWRDDVVDGLPAKRICNLNYRYDPFWYISVLCYKYYITYNDKELYIFSFNLTLVILYLSYNWNQHNIDRSGSHSMSWFSEWNRHDIGIIFNYQLFRGKLTWYWCKTSITHQMILSSEKSQWYWHDL